MTLLNSSKQPKPEQSHHHKIEHVCTLPKIPFGSIIITSCLPHHHQYKGKHRHREVVQNERRSTDRGRVRQVGVSIWWWHHALVAIEVHLPRKRPPFLERERARVLPEEQLRLHVAVRPGLHEQIVVVLHSVEHAGVICKQNHESDLFVAEAEGE